MCPPPWGGIKRCCDSSICPSVPPGPARCALPKPARCTVPRPGHQSCADCGSICDRRGISSRHAIPCSNRATVHISDGCLPLKFGLLQTWNNFSGVFLFWSPYCVLHYVACLLGRRFGGSYTKLMACVDIPFVLPCLEANCKAAISKHSEHWYVVDVSVSLQ